MAGVFGLIVLIVLVLLVKSCRDSARKDAFKTYVRDVAALVQVSDTESKNLFALLAKPSGGQVQLQNALNGYASDAQQLVDRANGTDRPDELAKSKGYFVDSLELRRDGLTTIARELRSALSGQGKQTAVSRIASQMQLFLASDVIYSQRVLPNITHPLKREKLLDQVEVPKSHFLPDLQWVRPSVVVAKLGGVGSGAGGPVAPGLHGMSLIGVTAKPGGQSLSTAGATSITVTPKLSFDVTVQDAGANDERDVVVQLSISGAGKPIVREQTLPTITAGAQKVVTIPLAAAPPIGRPVQIKVQVNPVPGEKKVDNNKATYPAIFTR